MLGACQTGERRDLAQIAQAAQPVEPQQVETPQPDSPAALLTLQISNLPVLLDRLDPLLVLALPPKAIEQWRSIRTVIGGAKTVSFLLYDFELDVPQGSTSPVLNHVDAALRITGQPAGALLATRDLLDQQLARLGALLPQGVNWQCQESQEELVCSTRPEAAHPKPQDLPTPDGDILKLQVDLEPVIRKSELLLGALPLWAVLPEEVASWKSLDLRLLDQPDSVRLTLTARKSPSIEVLDRVFAPPGNPVQIARGSTPAAVITSLHNLETLSQELQKWTSGKLGPGDLARPKAWLDSSWQTQLLELASGTAGLLLTPEVKLSDPVESVLWFLQVSDERALQSRLEYVFKKARPKTEDRELKTGDHLMMLVRRGKGKTTESFAWMTRNQISFMASSPRLEALSMALYSPAWKQKELETVSLGPDEWVAGFVDFERLTAHLSLGQGALVEAAFTNLAHSVAQKLDQRLLFRLRRLGNEDPSMQILSFEIDNLLGILAVVSKEMTPLLKGAVVKAIDRLSSPLVAQVPARR